MRRSMGAAAFRLVVNQLGETYSHLFIMLTKYRFYAGKIPAGDCRGYEMMPVVKFLRGKKRAPVIIIQEFGERRT